jgi:hypothetical protein
MSVTTVTQSGFQWLSRGQDYVPYGPYACCSDRLLTGDISLPAGPTGEITIYRRDNKPALGPLGDSLDDLGAQ